MTKKTWLITGVSSGFGYEMTKQLLERGDAVIGTVRRTEPVQSFITQFPSTFFSKLLDMTDTLDIRRFVDTAFAQHGKIDVVVSNAGYGLFGAAEELSNAEVNHIIATNLTGSITLIRAALPHLRVQGSGRIIQISSYGGQVAFAGNSLYHATKWGIEGFCEAVAQGVAPFGIGMTIIEPGGARTQFRYGSAKVATLMQEYDTTPAHNFKTMLDPANGLAAGDPVKMAACMIESISITPAPLRMVSGIMISQSVMPYLNFGSIVVGRTIHTLASHWYLLLMAIHLGLHLEIILAAINRVTGQINMGKSEKMLAKAFGILMPLVLPFIMPFK